MSEMSSIPTEPAAPASNGGNVSAISPEKPQIEYASPRTPGPAPRTRLFSAEAWSPLKIELFRSLYIATSIAQIGTWVREAGGPWLMKLLTSGDDTPVMVGRVLLFSSLPICLFSVFAGALADVLDRRKLLIFTQAWMLIVSAVLGILTIIPNGITAGGLLGLTFLVGTGTALAGPALQALLPELVPKKDLALAINLNSVALNVARAVGPAMFILVVWKLPGKLGCGISFLLTALSFVWAIWVLFQWKRPSQRAAIHGEEMWNAIRSGYHYTLYSPANRAILLRVLTFIVPAVVMWSQVPIIAVQLLGLTDDLQKERASAELFAFVGMGAILGVLLMPGLHKRFKIDPVVNVCTACFAAGLIMLSRVHSIWQAMPLMAFLGINWVIIPTNFNTATQKSVPLWVKGRAISFYLTVLFGSFVIGAGIWGNVTKAFNSGAHPTGVSVSLLIGGIVMGGLLVLARWFPLTLNEGLDLTSAFIGPPPEPLLPDIVPSADPLAGPMPVVPVTTVTATGAVTASLPAAPQAPATETAPTSATTAVETSLAGADAAAGASSPAAPVVDTLSATAPPSTPAASTPSAGGPTEGPVQATLHYHVPPERAAEFLAVMKQVGQQRRRNGASGWRLEAGNAGDNGTIPYSEIIRYRSTGEHARQAARMTKHDVALLDKARAFHTGSEDLPGRSEILTGEAADEYADLKKKAASVLWHGFDRFFDETARVFDRYAGMFERDRKKRQNVQYREVRIRIPE
jgi:MFS family permease